MDSLISLPLHSRICIRVSTSKDKTPVLTNHIFKVPNETFQSLNFLLVCVLKKHFQ